MQIFAFIICSVAAEVLMSITVTIEKMFSIFTPLHSGACSQASNSASYKWPLSVIQNPLSTESSLQIELNLKTIDFLY